MKIKKRRKHKRKSIPVNEVAALFYAVFTGNEEPLKKAIADNKMKSTTAEGRKGDGG